MTIVDLPDDILVHIFKHYLSLNELIAVSNTCNRFHDLIEAYGSSIGFMLRYPLIDTNYPNGYNEYFRISKNYSKKYENIYKLKTFSKLIDKKFDVEVIYSYREKMLPHIQIDDATNDSTGFTSVYLSDANKLVWLDLNRINECKTQRHKNTPLYSSYRSNNRPSSTFKKNEIFVKKHQLFNRKDIRSFLKKSDTLVSFSENSIKVHSTTNNTDLNLINRIRDFNGIKINCVDFTTKLNTLVYGCSNGLLKIHKLKHELDNFGSFEHQQEPYAIINVNDRILRCVFSPSYKFLATGTASINQCLGDSACPLRIHDFEKLKETQKLKAQGAHKIGDGVLALSFIDENTVMSAGYDTFIRIFDLRSNNCVQSLEEPEDMSIYSVCCSKYYGLLSGNDRQGMVRYWDRRKNQIISTFLTSNYNSPVYSLACTPDTIFAGLNYDISVIDFR